MNHFINARKKRQSFVHLDKGGGIQRQSPWRIWVAPNLMLVVVCLWMLVGCSGSKTEVSGPEIAVDGAVWSEDWTLIGNVLGVEKLGYDLVLQENKDSGASSQMSYATWSIGESKPFDAQLEVLLGDYGFAEQAEEGIQEWLKAVSELYEVGDTGTKTCNEQTFTVISYVSDSEDNSYTRGVSAFGTYGQYVLMVELSCVDSFDGDEMEILMDFLNHCHYNADILDVEERPQGTANE